MSMKSREESARRSIEKTPGRPFSQGPGRPGANLGRLPDQRSNPYSDPNPGQGPESPSKLHLLVGTYTQGTDSMGIYSLLFNSMARTLEAEHTITRNPNPSFLHLRNPLLFAAQENSRTGAAATYLLDGDGALSHLGSSTDAESAGTCHVTLHPNGRWLYGANYESGTLSCWPVRLDNRLGPLRQMVRHTGNGPNRARQQQPHIHSTAFLPQSDILVAVDLGTDTLTLYRASQDDGILPDPIAVISTPPGFGPRIVAFHPTLPIAAVIGELANRVILYRVDEEGHAWKPYCQRDLPTRTGALNKAAHVAFSHDGRLLFASVRGRDAISVIHLDDKGIPTKQSCFPSGGKSPRHFSLSPCSRYLAVANTASGNVVVFGLDGCETAVGAYDIEAHDPPAEELCCVSIPHPSCVIWA